MSFFHAPHDIPDVILLLGTDASGKDHVANVLERFIRKRGGNVEKRKRFFSSRPTNESSSIQKGLFDHLQESAFLALYPRMGAVLPFFMNALIRWDVARFRAPDKKLIVVGHNGLRALAFHWGRSERSAAAFHVPAYLREAFRKAKEKTGAHAIVLDVHHAVRQARIASRMRHNVADLFDRYMMQNPERSERIEACLVLAARELLGAQIMLNNDLHEEEIVAQLNLAVGKNTTSNPHLG